MRVISGTNKGQKLLGPRGDNGRPTDDKVKEAVFNILFPLKHECIALDLFACTGSIGIEFLSRGAKKVYFSELKYDNIKIMKENIEKTKFSQDAIVLHGNFSKNLGQIRDQIDYVYIDPPYESDLYSKSFKQMLESSLFDRAKFIVEIDKDYDFSEDFDQLERIFHRKYGRKEISIYERKYDESNLSR